MGTLATSRAARWRASGLELPVASGCRLRHLRTLGLLLPLWMSILLRCVQLSQAVMAGLHCWSSRTGWMPRGGRSAQSRCHQGTMRASASTSREITSSCLSTQAQFIVGRYTTDCQLHTNLFMTSQQVVSGRGRQLACFPTGRSCDWHQHGSVLAAQRKHYALSCSSKTIGAPGERVLDVVKKNVTTF